MRFSTSDGVRLWTATTGTATPAVPVVILHGGPGLWDDYAVLAEMIDDLTVVHRFDQRGCGRSDPSGLQTMQRLAQDIDELRSHWGHERIVVVGHSFGATLALVYAASLPMHVTYIHGDGDPRPASAVQELATHTPNHTFHLVPNAGHSPRREQPEEVRGLLRGVVLPSGTL